MSYHAAMKLRLHDDSVRIRLSRSEVEQLGSGRAVRAATRFYTGRLDVAIVPEGDGVDAAFDAGGVTIRVSAAQAREWSVNDIEGLYGMSGPCKVAIEKDYACLHQSGDRNEGTFPNPSAL